MKKLRVALVGLGIMGANHARVLSSLEGVDLVAIADPQGDVQGLLPNHTILKSVDEVISIGIDYCVIAAPTALHEEISRKLMAAKIHVLIEKPIAHTLESARRIVRESKTHEVIGAVGHIERFNAALQEARKRILQGDIGEIHQIATRRIGPFPARIADVGVVMDLATHDIDLTAWVTGSDYNCVYAQASTKSGRHHEDLVAVVGQLENGIVVSHLVNWLSPLKERKIIITGDKGTFVVDTLTSDLTLYKNGTFSVSQGSIAHFKGVTQGDIHILAFDKPEPLRVQHLNFRDAVMGKSAEIVELESSTRVVEVAEAIINSCRNQMGIFL